MRISNSGILNSNWERVPIIEKKYEIFAANCATKFKVSFMFAAVSS